MIKDLLLKFGKSSEERVEKALHVLRLGGGILVMDDKSRENEGDMIFSAGSMTVEQMALAIRHGSGIVCLALPEKRCQQLELPLMVQCNTSRYRTAFTVTIEAAVGVTTGVSALDRLRTIHVSIQDDVKADDLSRPGHVFPLCSQQGGVLVRLGHTEAAVDLMLLAGLKPFAVLCEVVNEDGSMARLLDIIEFACKNCMPVLTVEDLVIYRLFYSV